MTLTTLSIDAQLSTNEEAPIVGEMAAEPGLIEVSRDDENGVTVHFRHVDSTDASLSASTTRAGAIALAEALHSAAN